MFRGKTNPSGDLSATHTVNLKEADRARQQKHHKVQLVRMTWRISEFFHQTGEGDLILSGVNRGLHDRHYLKTPVLQADVGVNCEGC